jgi:hypothetical protein
MREILGSVWSFPGWTTAPLTHDLEVVGRQRDFDATDQQVSSPITLVLNWDAELKK